MASQTSSPTTEPLAGELAALKGLASPRDAIEYAVRLALAVERDARARRRGMAADLISIARRHAQPRDPDQPTAATASDRLFDEQGLP